MMLLIISLLMSVFVAVFVVLFKNIFKRGLSDSHQLESLGVKVYGSIPLSQLQMTEKRGWRKKSTPEKQPLLAVREPEDLTVEAIRSLRTGLFFLLKEAKNKVMMVVGPTSGIGKSFVAGNLAVVFAQSGLRVLLVDCDIRKGSLHRLFEINQNKGLSELLSGRGDIKDCLYPSEVSGLDLVPRGGSPENPSELLLTSKFAEFCHWASETYDVVLLDTPPLLAVSDAAIIGNYASTSLMVARFEVTSVKEIDLAIKRLAQQGHLVTGVVLNSVVQRAAQYFQHGHFEHYHYKSEAP
jgi:tyrosine-protein kinase Etk/Wzc